MTAANRALTDQVAEMTRTGFTLADIARSLGVTERTVSRCRKRAGIAGPAAVPLTAEQIATAQQLLDDGATVAETARTIGCSQQTVSRYFPGRTLHGRAKVDAILLTKQASHLLKGSR